MEKLWAPSGEKFQHNSIFFNSWRNIFILANQILQINKNSDGKWQQTSWLSTWKNLDKKGNNGLVVTNRTTRRYKTQNRYDCFSKNSFKMYVAVMFHMHFQMYMSYHTFFGTVPTSQQKKRESIHYQPLHYNSNLSYKVVDTWGEWAGSASTPPPFSPSLFSEAK